MARMKKAEVIAELKALGVEFDTDDYNELCSLRKKAIEGSLPKESTPPTAEPKQITIVNRIRKRPTFLADSVRNERDAEFLNKEIGQRKHKGKLLRVTTVKEYVLSADGHWETTFIIDLKE